MSQETEEKPPSKATSRPPAPASAGTGGRSSIGALRMGFAAALRLGSGEEAGSVRVDASTHMAAERSYMAAERTLMAWIRTSLSMISFGFTIGKLGQTVKEIEIKGVVLQQTHMVSIVSVAYFLVILGTVALLGAILQYLLNIAEYVTMGLRRRFSIAFLVGLLLVLVGSFALTALVMRL